MVNENRHKTIELARRFAKALEEKLIIFDQVEINGPNPCKISRINNKHRYNIIVKVRDDELEATMDILRNLIDTFINEYKDTSFIPALNPANIN